MKKLMIRTIEEGSYSIGKHTTNPRTEKLVVVGAANKKEALAKGKKEWRKKFDPSGYYRVYNERKVSND